MYAWQPWLNASSTTLHLGAGFDLSPVTRNEIVEMNHAYVACGPTMCTPRSHCFGAARLDGKVV